MCVCCAPATVLIFKTQDSRCCGGNMELQTGSNNKARTYDVPNDGNGNRRMPYTSNNSMQGMQPESPAVASTSSTWPK